MSKRPVPRAETPRLRAGGGQGVPRPGTTESPERAGSAPFRRPRPAPPPSPRWAGPDGRARAPAAVRHLVTAAGLAHASVAEVARTLTPEQFAAHHLRPLLEQVYQSSIYHAVTEAVPALHTWRQPPVPPDYWQGEEGCARAQAATARLLTALAIPTDDPGQLVAAAPPAVFAWGGLSEMLAVVYARSAGAALRAVFPSLPAWRQERVPYGYWQGIAGTERARAATQQLLGELGWGGLPAAVLARQVTRRTFAAHGLRGMLDTVYAGSPYAALHELFPTLHPWQMGTTPMGYWQGPQARRHAQAATRWLLGQVGLIAAAPAQIGATVDYTTFARWGLDGMLDVVYGHSPYAALVAVVPDLQPWQMAEVPAGYWQGAAGRDHAQAATRWLLEQQGLGGPAPVLVASALTQDAFSQAGLGGMLQVVYTGSPYAALADVVPSLAPWQMSHVPAGYWHGPVGRERAPLVTRWLLEQYGLAAQEPEHIAATLTHADFAAAGFSGMLHQVYGGSPYAALAALFPALRPWQMGTTPMGYWQGAAGRDHARAATRWLLEQQGLLDEAPAVVAGRLDLAVFGQAGLGGMVHRVYGNSPYAALADLLPIVQPWQMRTGVPQGYWQGGAGQHHARAATRWLLEQLGLAAAPAHVAATVTAAHFVQAGLGGMLQILYRGSVAAALDDCAADRKGRGPCGG